MAPMPNWRVAPSSTRAATWRAIASSGGDGRRPSRSSPWKSTGRYCTRAPCARAARSIGPKKPLRTRTAGFPSTAWGWTSRPARIVRSSRSGRAPIASSNPTGSPAANPHATVSRGRTSPAASASSRRRPLPVTAARDASGQERPGRRLLRVAAAELRLDLREPGIEAALEALHVGPRREAQPLDGPRRAALDVGEDALGACLEIAPAAANAALDVRSETLGALHELAKRALLASSEERARLLADARDDLRPVLLQAEQRLAERAQRPAGSSVATYGHPMSSSISPRSAPCPGPR